MVSCDACGTMEVQAVRLFVRRQQGGHLSLCHDHARDYESMLRFAGWIEVSN